MVIQVGKVGFDVEACRELGKEKFISTFKGIGDTGGVSLEEVWNRIAVETPALEEVINEEENQAFSKKKKKK